MRNYLKNPCCYSSLFHVNFGLLFKLIEALRLILNSCFKHALCRSNNPWTSARLT